MLARYVAWCGKYFLPPVGPWDGSTMVERPRRPARDLERISRGAILAIALSGATLAPLMAVNAQEPEEPECVPGGPIPAGDPNMYTRPTCKGFFDYIKNTGAATEDLGMRCPGRAGVTGIDISVASGPIEWRLQTRVFCACNNKLYDNPQACLKECRTNLECFPRTICGPAPGEVCVQGLIPSPTALSRSPIRIMRWRPKRQLNSACAAFMKAFESEVQAHEEAHYADNQKLANDAAFKLKNKSYWDCGATPEKALERIKEQITRDIQRVSEAFVKEAKAAAKRLHASGEVPIRGRVDCGLCDQKPIPVAPPR